MATALLLGGAAPPAASMHTTAILAAETLAVFGADGWKHWWQADRAPATWRAAHPLVAEAVVWRPVSGGLEIGELRLSGTGEAWRLRVILVRLDPARVRLTLAAKADGPSSLGPWSVSTAPADALLALNAGQFSEDGPWGWVVHRGRAHGSARRRQAMMLDGGLSAPGS